MTAAELIEKLKELPPDTRIVVQDCRDAGVNDVVGVATIEILFDSYAGWCDFGQHEVSRHGEPAAIIFGRDSDPR
jgi:hypothetical protein